MKPCESKGYRGSLNEKTLVITISRVYHIMRLFFIKTMQNLIKEFYSAGFGYIIVMVNKQQIKRTTNEH